MKKRIEYKCKKAKVWRVFLIVLKILYLLLLLLTLIFFSVKLDADICLVFIFLSLSLPMPLNFVKLLFFDFVAPKIYSEEMVRKNGLDYFIRDIDFKRPTLRESEVYCGQKAICSMKRHVVVPYREIAVCQYGEISRDNLVFFRYVILYIRSGRRITFPITVKEFEFLIKNYIIPKCPDALVMDLTKESKTFNEMFWEYKRIKKKRARINCVFFAFLSVAVLICGLLIYDSIKRALLVSGLFVVIAVIFLFLGREKKNADTEICDSVDDTAVEDVPMIYFGYSESELIVAKANNFKALLRICVPILIGIFFMFWAAYDIVTAELEQTKDISYTSFVDGKEYYFDELVVVDVYDFYEYPDEDNSRYITIGDSQIIMPSFGFDYNYYTDSFYDEPEEETIDLYEFGKADVASYLVYFTDGDGKRVYALLRTDNEDDIHLKCKSHISTDAEIGSLVLSGSFYISIYDGTPDYDIMKIYDKVNTGLPGEFFYASFESGRFKTLDEYWSKRQMVLLISLTTSLLFWIPSAFGVRSLVRKRKQLDVYLSWNNTEIAVSEDL